MTTGNLDIYLDALGTVTPVYTVTVVSRVAGEITQIHFKEGQIVKKNDLLAVIDPRPYVAGMIARTIAPQSWKGRADTKRPGRDIRSGSLKVIGRLVDAAGFARIRRRGCRGRRS